MTATDRFSDRADVRRPKDGQLLRGTIPVEIRNYVIASLQPLHVGFWKQLLEILSRECDLDPKYATVYPWPGLKGALIDMPWFSLLDSIEIIAEHLGIEFEEDTNRRFLRYYVAYEMRDGRVVELGATADEETIAVAAAVLSDPRLSGPDEAFQEARLAFLKRPEPDSRGAIVRAVDALEGVVRVALADENVTLGTGITRIISEQKLHEDIGNSIKSLYRYASDEDGLRHGPTAPVSVDRSTAELCLAQAAAAMVWIARLYDYGVRED